MWLRLCSPAPQETLSSLGHPTAQQAETMHHEVGVRVWGWGTAQERPRGRVLMIDGGPGEWWHRSFEAGVSRGGVTWGGSVSDKAEEQGALCGTLGAPQAWAWLCGFREGPGQPLPLGSRGGAEGRMGRHRGMGVSGRDCLCGLWSSPPPGPCAGMDTCLHAAERPRWKFMVLDERASCPGFWPIEGSAEALNKSMSRIYSVNHKPSPHLPLRGSRASGGWGGTGSFPGRGWTWGSSSSWGLGSGKGQGVWGDLGQHCW